VEESKPAPDVFRAAMAAGRVDPHRAVAVGDSTWDVEGARAAGIACVGLESGGFSRHDLSEAGAIAVYRDAEELLAQFDTSPLRPLSTS
ncbi:MAG: HAD family hydrolase, partial [Acidimicrobiales bacterium]